MEFAAVSEWVAAPGAFLAGVGGLVTGIAALRKARSEEREVVEVECNERLLEMVERHQMWADRELGKRERHQEDE